MSSQRQKKQKIPKRNYLVPLVKTKTGGGKHKDKRLDALEKLVRLSEDLSLY